MRYSALALLGQAWRGHQGWPRAWRDPEIRKGYSVVSIGGGGHGLATAWYLARNHERPAASAHRTLFPGAVCARGRHQ